ncbi:hypothetical protein L2004_07370 [Lactobacillus mulieris]|uniref:hypothetical protein n=1 Tax=Lactobacillus mulieris TaxID=2508708 RepID=UPI0022CD779A|nr:hypothetical protein [Lactobacillus mulieris]MCZ9648347.1 hypothetical protein [Lactobacillus mulieris]
MKKRKPLYVISAIVVAVIAIVVLNLPKNESQKVSEVTKTQSSNASSSEKAKKTKKIKKSRKHQVDKKQAVATSNDAGKDDNSGVTAEMKKYGSDGYFTVPIAIQGTWYESFGGNLGMDAEVTVAHDTTTISDHSIKMSAGTYTLMKSVSGFNDKFATSITMQNQPKEVENWLDTRDLNNGKGFGTFPWTPEQHIGKYYLGFLMSDVDGQPILISKEGGIGSYNVSFKSQSLAEQYSQGDKKDKVIKIVTDTFNNHDI